MHQMFIRKKNTGFSQTLVKLQCMEVSAGKIHYDIPEEKIEDCGIGKCEQLSSVIVEIKHIEESGLNFDHGMTQRHIYVA